MPDWESFPLLVLAPRQSKGHKRSHRTGEDESCVGHICGEKSQRRPCGCLPDSKINTLWSQSQRDRFLRVTFSIPTFEHVLRSSGICSQPPLLPTPRMADIWKRGLTGDDHCGRHLCMLPPKAWNLLLMRQNHFLLIFNRDNVRPRSVN